MFALGASKARTPPCGGAHLADVRMAVVTVRYSERPELWQWSSDLSSQVWPEYNLHGDVTNRYWARLYDDFPTSSSCYMTTSRTPARDNAGYQLSCFSQAQNLCILPTVKCTHGLEKNTGKVKPPLRSASAERSRRTGGAVVNRRLLERPNGDAGATCTTPRRRAHLEAHTPQV